jgi:hypothetical protein
LAGHVGNEILANLQREVIPGGTIAYVENFDDRPELSHALRGFSFENGVAVN